MKIETIIAKLDCGHPESDHSEITRGYGQTADGKKICYECCAENDRKAMLDNGKIILYLTPANLRDTAPNGFRGLDGEKVSRWQVSNWPGSLKFNAYVKKGAHNIAGSRYDAWFTGPDGKEWHGVNYGEMSQLCHCRRSA
jgi:hypothetical protein